MKTLIINLCPGFCWWHLTIMLYFLPVKTAMAFQKTDTSYANVLEIKARPVDASDTTKSRTIPKACAGEIIQIRISNPVSLLKNRPTDKSKLVLYANGIPLEGIYADWFSQFKNEDIRNNKIPPMDSRIWVRFYLKRDTSSKAAWNYLYQNTQHWYQNSIVIDASVGWQGMFPINNSQVDSGKLKIIYFEMWVFCLWLGAFVICIGFFSYLAFWTDLLRECGITGPYSLSLSQLLFWTTLVIAAFIYTLVLTDIASSLNTSVLLLLGVSITTTGFASFIDTKKPADTTLSVKEHKNFIKDVLSDGCSYSVQRVQIFTWNLVLGIYFVWFTITNKSMPEFSTTLLLLMGVSSASYLAGKVPENEMQKNKAQKILLKKEQEDQK